MALLGSFAVTIQGQTYSNGQVATITNPLGSPVLATCVLTNLGTPADLIFMQCVPPQVEPPIAFFFPANAFVSNQLQGQNWVPFPTGGQLGNQVHLPIPTVAGQVVTVQIQGSIQAAAFTQQPWSGQITVNIVGAGSVINPPTPTPTGSEFSPLGIALLGIGGLAIAVGLSGEK